MSLKISGTKIVDQDGKEIVLRGAGLGGWMNMENFISGSKLLTVHVLWANVHIQGYPGCEYQIREALTVAIGKEKSDLFFDKVCQTGLCNRNI